VEALEELLAPPEEFAKQNEQGGQGSGMPPDLIPSVVELKLLRGLQEDVYEETRDLDGRQDMAEEQRHGRIEGLGARQRELLDLGREMLRRLEQRRGPPAESPDPTESPADPDPAPDVPDEGEPEPEAQSNSPSSPGDER
jgi:hypothetical protein